VVRVIIVVEGQSEEAFVSAVLAPALWSQQTYLTLSCSVCLDTKEDDPTTRVSRKTSSCTSSKTRQPTVL